MDDPLQDAERNVVCVLTICVLFVYIVLLLSSDQSLISDQYC